MNTTFHNHSIAETAKKLASDIANGLTTAEAKRRLEANGYNEFQKKKHTNIFIKFLNQFKSFMIIVLIVAAIISGVVGYINGEGFFDAIIILIIVVCNAIIGVFQEAKAEKSLEALEKMSAPHCKVVRNGETIEIESRELVVGDVVIIETGDNVPADLRLFEAINLKIQEAALTGESVPVEKQTEAIEENATIGDKNNMAFSSCSVTYGRGRGIVVATGNHTEVGKIASMIQSVETTQTPMQKRLDQLGKMLAIAALAICTIIFIIGLLYGNNLLEMFMTAVSLAAAAIPEGLPAVSTIVLAIGVQRLAQKNAIVRNLPSVETLGSTTVICSDKTGTLTQNKMTVTKIYVGEQIIEADNTDINNEQLIQIAVLANDAKINTEGNSIGDPTETALLDLGIKKGINKNTLEQIEKRVAEIPFDSERKLMTSIHKNNTNGNLTVATKGALDELLARCNRIKQQDIIREITPRDIEKIKQANLTMGSSALRVLAMAYKTLESIPTTISSENIEHELIFVGMVGMIDPPRDEARDAVMQCRIAGIKPVMITGDHKITATAIARMLGIAKESDNILTGTDVEQLSDSELKQTVKNAAVFARVAPEHKVRIVKAFQENNNIVAMTGDGVNDAPALKLANIGVAMGITGTDVSKEAADVVLTDDNFATIVSAVSEGRRIYDNLLKSIQFMLSTNLGEIVVLFVAAIFGMITPLLPIQILWINLVTDSFPALALSVDPASKDIMQRKPTDKSQGFLNKHFLTKIGLQGLLIGALTLTAYHIGLKTSIDVARTMTFATVAFSQMTMIFSIRSGRSMAFNGMFSNKYLWGAISLVVALMLLVLFVPALQSIFHVVSLDSTQWIWVTALSFAALIINDLFKLITNRIKA